MFNNTGNFTDNCWLTIPEQFPKTKTVWQRNYYEHIICNGVAYQDISNYIIENSTTWGRDKLCI